MPKKSQTETRPCPQCGSKMRFHSKPETIEYKGHTTTISTEAWWCTSCDEGVLEGKALKANETAFMALKAEVDGILDAESVAKVRKKLKLSQRKAGELLGGGPRAFQKYESGAIMVSAPMSNLLRLLGNDPTRIQELQQLQAE
jgi:HTH-type transcriptional regulator / antitoxin MqsA